jgi:hypothetical protein
MSNLNIDCFGNREIQFSEGHGNHGFVQLHFAHYLIKFNSTNSFTSKESNMLHI